MMCPQVATRDSLSSFPSTAAELASVSPFSESFITAVSSRHISPYTDIEMTSRRTEKIRHLSQPDPGLQALQRWILENYLWDASQIHSAAYAYVPGRNPLDAAREHLESSWIVRVDISDFFHTIDEKMVYYAARRSGATKPAALLLSRVTTRLPQKEMSWLPVKYLEDVAPGRKPLGFLPQGAPTSGHISNLVAFRLDLALEIFAVENNLRYSRYSDDIFFSANHSRFLNISLTPPRPEEIIPELEHRVMHYGFELNPKKTKIMRQGRRQAILGLLVDSNELRLTREKRHDLDFHFRSIEKFGLESHAEVQGFASPEQLGNYLRGYVSYLSDVNQSRAQPYQEKLEALELI